MGPKLPQASADGSKPPKAGGESFLDKFLGLFTSSDDPERRKQRELKAIAKELKKSRLHYYAHPAGTVEPALARFFYEFYRILGPAQTILANAGSSGALKAIIVESALSEEERAVRDRLQEEAIQERAKSADPKAVGEQVKEDVRKLYQSFDPDRINQIDGRYGLLGALLDLISFDYYFLLKKFDSNLPEHDLAYKPRFESINGEYITEELKDFLEILPSLQQDADWGAVLDTLKAYRNLEVIARDGMRKLFSQIASVQKSGVLAMIVRLADKDPSYAPMTRTFNEHIVEPYLTKIKGQAEIALQRIVQGKRTEKIEQLSQLVFGTASISRLSNYSEKANMAFSKKMLGGFLYIAALNYLKAFLLDYLKKDIRDIVDMLLVKGKWSVNQPSQQLSEAYHQLLKTSEALTQFDESLADDGDWGRKMKSILIKADRDKKAFQTLHALLDEINDQAKGMIAESSAHFVAIAKVLKLALDDYVKAPPELIINWRELKATTDKDIKALIVGVYKRIYNFVQLMSFYK